MSFDTLKAYEARMVGLAAQVEQNGCLKGQSERRPDYRLLLTRSTSPGVQWQVTSFDGAAPIGHRDYDRLMGGAPTQNALAEFASIDIKII